MQLRALLAAKWRRSLKEHLQLMPSKKAVPKVLDAGRELISRVNDESKEQHEFPQVGK
jgi:hypothetical protein